MSVSNRAIDVVASHAALVADGALDVIGNRALDVVARFSTTSIVRGAIDVIAGVRA